MPETISVSITATYAAIFGLMFIYLSAQVIKARRGGYGADNHPEAWRLNRPLRGHGNFAEYVPLTLLLILLLEIRGASPILIHALALTLLAGRLGHAIAFQTEKGVGNLRVIGMMATFVALACSAIANLPGIISLLT